MTTFKFYLLSSLGAITLKEIYSNWKMFSREGLGSELKDTRKRWSKKTKLAFDYYTTQSAKKPCKLADAILSRKERLPKSEMNAGLQKHSSVGVLWKQCSWKFRKIHRKTPVPESLFNKVVGLKPATLLKKSLWHRCFSVNFAKFLRTPFLPNTSSGCFWVYRSLLLLMTSTNGFISVLIITPLRALGKGLDKLITWFIC